MFGPTEYVLQVRVHSCCLDVFMFVWVERIVMSTAYVVSFVLVGGVGMSDVYILNSVGESTSLCGTLVFIVVCFEFVLLYLYYV